VVQTQLFKKQAENRLVKLIKLFFLPGVNHADAQTLTAYRTKIGVFFTLGQDQQELTPNRLGLSTSGAIKTLSFKSLEI
jgi:hypothetical protein